MTEDRFVRMSEAAKMLGIHRGVLFRWIKRGAVPAPVRLSPRVVGYPMSQLVKIVRGEK